MPQRCMLIGVGLETNKSVVLCMIAAAKAKLATAAATTTTALERIVQSQLRPTFFSS
jgi:hypothetical protein